MARVATALLLGTLVACATGCSHSATEGEAMDATASRPPSQVDPMTFVLVYQTDFERILAKHEDDCEGALTSLLRFVADRKGEFFDRVDREPPGWQPAAAGEMHLELLMKFAERCPRQVARLNAMLHGIAP